MAFCLWSNYFKDTSKMRKAGACCIQEYRLTIEKQICSLSPVNTHWPEVSMRFDYFYFLALTLEHAALRHFVSMCRWEVYTTEIPWYCLTCSLFSISCNLLVRYRGLIRFKFYCFGKTTTPWVHTNVVVSFLVTLAVVTIIT